MKRFAIVLLCIVSVLCLNHNLAAQQAVKKGKKLIEWGFDEPDTAFMRKNIQKMEQMPFDGLIFHVLGDKGSNLAWEMWGKRKLDLTEFQKAIDDLKATPFRRLTDRFVRGNVYPGNVDWFDDRAWTAVAQNFSVAAQIARQGGCKGIMLDTEQYGDKLFCYDRQKQKATKTFAEYRCKVRQRGQQWMKAVDAQYPGITLLVTYAYAETGRFQNSAGPQGNLYGLLADFLDGMLDVCSPQTKIVDAWEYAYRYKEKKQFIAAYETIRVKLASWTGVPDKYCQHVQAGFGIFLDTDSKEKGWHVDDPSKNYFPPLEFENVVRSALRVSDEYVWIYTEQPRWWTNERLPQAYIDALSKARQ